MISCDKKVRDSSFELLRIIAMFSIVFCHFATHGNFQSDSQNISVMRLWWYFMEMGGSWGVNVFVLISGYFLIGDKNSNPNIKKIFVFLGQILFYSILIYTLFCVFGFSEFSFKSFIKTLFPITFNSWWFASTYFVLYLIHPFINMLLNTLNKVRFQNLVIILLVIWCLIPTFTFNSYQSNSLLWFVTLYCVAAYIRKFGLNSKITCKHYVILFVAFSLLRYLSAVVLAMLGTKISFAASNTLAFYGQQSVLTFLSALSAFMVFKQLKIKYTKSINKIASATFGVYLIHENIFMRPFLWRGVFHNALLQDSIYLIPYSLLATVTVFAACVIIDLIRKAVIEKPYTAFLDKCLPSCIKPFHKIVELLRNIVFGGNENTLQ